MPLDAQLGKSQSESRAQHSSAGKRSRWCGTLPKRILLLGAAGDFGRRQREQVTRQTILIAAGTHLRGFSSRCSKRTVFPARVVSTDPPYYDNIGYADLSDFFYVWLRRSLRPVFPDLFATLAVPKAEELVATPYRHGNKEKAETFFLAGMTEAMRRLAEQTHPGFPVTIYYAFKQSEKKGDEGTSSTGWETFLDAVIRPGLRSPALGRCARNWRPNDRYGHQRPRLLHRPGLPPAPC